MNISFYNHKEKMFTLSNGEKIPFYEGSEEPSDLAWLLAGFMEGRYTLQEMYTFCLTCIINQTTDNPMIIRSIETPRPSYWEDVKRISKQAIEN